MFLQVCVCPQGGGCLPQCMLGCQTPQDQADTTPRTRQTPLTRQTPPQYQANTPLGPGRPPQTRQTPPPWTRQTPPGSRLQHMVYERPVCILLECILVFIDL